MMTSDASSFPDIQLLTNAELLRDGRLEYHQCEAEEDEHDEADVGKGDGAHIPAGMESNQVQLLSFEKEGST